MRKSFKKKIYRPTWVEIDLKAIAYNFKSLKEKGAPRTEILAVVKDNAYGHGMVEVAKTVVFRGAEMLGVSSLEEGILLRQNKIRIPILVFGNVLDQDAKVFLDYRLTPTVYTHHFAQALDQAACCRKQKLPVHVLIDTGMGRLGVWHKEAPLFICAVSGMKSLRLQGLFTHFPCADTNRRFTENQVQLFENLIQEMQSQGIKFQYVHADNSMGLACYPRIFNLARPGLMLYGLYPDLKNRSKIKLRPAMSVKSKITFLKTVEKGRGLSYGHTFYAKRKTKVATIPIGYSDGYLRVFSNNADVLVGGKRCPLVGRVTMDQILCDVSRVPSVREGDEAVFCGRQKKQQISADDLAKRAKTIHYEIVCLLGSRLPHFFRK